MVEASVVPLTLDLHVELYPRLAVEQAMAAFAALGEIRLERQGQYHRVTILPAAGGGVGALGHEFANYALSLAVVGPAGDVNDGAAASVAVDAS